MTPLQLVTDMIYPRRCPVCDRPVKPPGALICRECADVPLKVEGRDGKTALCAKCGKPLADPGEVYCPDCARLPHLFDEGCAVFRYRSVSGALYRFKYEGRQEYAAWFGKVMADKLLQAFPERKLLERYGKPHPDLLVPVPVSKQRMAQRGYNQAALLAREISKRTGIASGEDALVRSRHTAPLRGMSFSMRQRCLESTFHAASNDVKLKLIVLVDDIYTTGATMDACSRALLSAGARGMLFITLAIGESLT